MGRAIINISKNCGDVALNIYREMESMPDAKEAF
jgi:hypothetical protein